ncbi:MAG: hypothetical protein AAB418_02300, partial [candidate division NC10 bacterium]
MSYLLLLAFQMAFFLACPVVTPESWRAANAGGTPSERFLAYVQSLARIIRERPVEAAGGPRRAASGGVARPRGTRPLPVG